MIHSVTRSVSIFVGDLKKIIYADQLVLLEDLPESISNDIYWIFALEKNLVALLYLPNIRKT